MGNYGKSISILKTSFQQSVLSNDQKNKLNVYKMLSDIYYELKNYDKAIFYIKKLLKLSWQMQNEEFEIVGYDLLGKYYIMKGEIDMGYYFHSRAMGNI